MKKLSESVWGDVRRRAEGITDRKENQIRGNIKDIKPVDIGCSVLWADRDFEIDGETEFLIDDVNDYEPLGWRRPTRKEANELMTDAHWDTDQGTLKGFNPNYTVTITHNDSDKLVFNCVIGKYSEYWIRENTEPAGYWSTFDFRAENQGAFFPHSVHSMAKLTEKCRVRFVRDKV